VLVPVRFRGWAALLGLAMVGFAMTQSPSRGLQRKGDRSCGTEPVHRSEEGSMEVLHDLFKAFVRVLDDEHLTRRLRTSFKQLIEEAEDYLPPISSPPFLKGILGG